MENKVEKWLEKRGQGIKNEWKYLTYDMANQCQSPIEKLFYIEWEYIIKQIPYPEYYHIMPQYKIDNYRVDFLIYFHHLAGWMNREKEYPKYNKEKSLIVELDSYLWHGSKPAQFAKEKERERELQKEGWNVMRFSGREIYRNVGKCVEEVLEYFSKIEEQMPEKYR